MPVRPTQAYTRFKGQSEGLLDFAVFVAYAVPALRADIDSVKSGLKTALPKPDFFHKSNRSKADDLLKTEAIYEQRLASYLLLAQFSFFESFVFDIISEMIDFHGGAKLFVERNENRAKQFIAPHPPHIAKLSASYKNQKSRLGGTGTGITLVLAQRAKKQKLPRIVRVLGQPRWGGFFVDVGDSWEQLLHLDGEGFGEFEAEGGLGGQDNLLLSGVGCSRGSCTCTQCCTDECAFATAGESADEGPTPGAAADEGRGTFPFALQGAAD